MVPLKPVTTFRRFGRSTIAPWLLSKFRLLRQLRTKIYIKITIATNDISQIVFRKALWKVKERQGVSTQLGAFGHMNSQR